MTRIPPLDLHAHIDPSIDAKELHDLDGVVFAVTRSLVEASTALGRHDDLIVWGVGCHPGLVRAQQHFSPEGFATLLERSPFVGELGLDGASRVAMETQRATLRSALAVLAEMPRIVSLHSYEATALLIEELEAQPVVGAILHWWLGDPSLTRRAVQLGCYFSVNASSVRRTDLLEIIPADRLLTETDHPFGDRYARRPRRPGNVEDVEKAIAAHRQMDRSVVRRQVWRNLGGLVKDTGCARLLPRSIRSILSAQPPAE